MNDAPWVWVWFCVWVCLSVPCQQVSALAAMVGVGTACWDVRLSSRRTEAQHFADVTTHFVFVFSFGTGCVLRIRRPSCGIFVYCSFFSIRDQQTPGEMGQHCSRILEDFTAGGTRPKQRQQDSSGLPKARPLLSWQRDVALPPTKGVFQASQNPADYAAIGLQGMKWQRLPGQINDQRINIDRCQQCQFFLLDQCDSVQIDECQQCVFFIGPTSGSVFIRNCTDCVFIVACGQLRTRDVKRCTISLYCAARPVIEASTELRLCCFSARHQYFMLEAHMKKAKLSAFNNLYWYVHDFTPSGRPNFEFMSQTEFESLYDYEMMRLQMQPEGFRTTFSAVPTLSAGVPEYISPEEDMQVYTSEVAIPHSVGLSNAAAIHSDATTRTLLIFTTHGLTEAQRLVQALELQRREYYALQGAGPADQLAQLIGTMEKIFTAEDVAQLLSVTSQQAFWSAARTAHGVSSSMAHIADRDPRTVDAKIRELVGDACVCILVASVVENPPLLAVHRTMAAQALRSTGRDLLQLDVARPASCEAMRRLSEIVFCTLPMAGVGFGAKM